MLSDDTKNSPQKIDKQLLTKGVLMLLTLTTGGALILAIIMNTGSEQSTPSSYDTRQPTPTPEPDEVLVRRGLKALQELLRYHYTLHEYYYNTDVEGDVVQQEGVYMKGRYSGVGLTALFLADHRSYRQEAGAWIEWSLADVLGSLRTGYDLTFPRNNALNIAANDRQSTRIQISSYELDRILNPLSAFSDLSPYEPQGVTRIGDEVLHGMLVRHYRYQAIPLWAMDSIPSSIQKDVWIDPHTAYVHKFSVTQGWAHTETTPVSEITISQHNDPSVKLPDLSERE